MPLNHRSILLSVLAASLGGCPKPNSPRGREVGVIVESTTSADRARVSTRYPGARVRALHPGAFEVFGVPTAAVRSLLPAARVSVNIFLNRDVDGVISGDVPNFSHLTTIHATEAWATSRGAGIIVAVIDTGVEFTHPTFAGAIAQRGYDFVDHDDLPLDEDGHGTFVAGLILGRGFGVAPEAKLLPLKALTTIGGDVASIAAAIHYAVDHGARVINLSAGVALPIEHPALARALDHAAAADVVLVTAAGNGDPATGLGFNLERSPVYPAASGRANQLTVAASTTLEVLAPYSNFGRSIIDVTAPGGLMPDDPLWSAGLLHRLGQMWSARAGTSAAAPLAAGVAALVRSARPHLNAATVREVVSTHGPIEKDLLGVTKTGRRLDARAAVLESVD